MKKRVVFPFLIILIFSFCSKTKESAPSPRIPIHEKKEPQAADDRPDRSSSEESSLQIKVISLVPETPTVLTDVSAIPELTDSSMENVEFQYQWYINGRQVEGLTGKVLEKSNFKKGAWLFCKTKAVADGEESNWFKSDIIRVHNSLPAFKPAPAAKMNIPGDFTCQVVATDPDDDPLIFELISPLDKGIVFDPKSGDLSWSLTEEIVKTMGDRIEIKLAVSDGDGEKVEGTITLQFTRTKQTQ